MSRDKRTKSTHRWVNPTSIVEAVANLEGVSVTHLEPPLYESIDPDALGLLLASDRADRSSVEVQFDYAGYRICVSSDGVLEVVEP